MSAERCERSWTVRGIEHRSMEDGDRAFVADSWIRSYRLSHAAGMIAMQDWRSVMSQAIDRVLSRPGVRVLVAHLPWEDSVGILGWMAYERTESGPPLVHYIYVKQAYRKSGVARGLFAKADIDPDSLFHYTCKTSVVHRIRNRIPNSHWTPLSARFDSEYRHEKNQDMHPLRADRA